MSQNMDGLAQPPQPQVQAPPQEQKTDINIDAKKLMLLEREYINKAIQLANTNKFTGDYYQLWKVKMTQILTTAQLIQVVTRNNITNIIPNNMTQWEDAKIIVLSGLSNEIASQYTTIHDPHDLWTTLDTVYNANTATTRSELRKLFQQLKLDETKSVSQYIETLKYTVSRMESMGMTVTDEEKTHQLFSGLPQEFSGTISHLQIANITDFNVIVSRVRDNAIVWEKNQQTEQANYTHTQNKSNTTSFKCFRCGKSGHRIAECTSSTPSYNSNSNNNNNNNKSRKPLYPDACVYCKRNNHKSDACYRKPRQQQPQMVNMVAEAVAAVLATMNINNNQEQANVATEQVHKVQQQQHQQHSDDTARTWTSMLDSAASRHLINDISLISNIHSLSSPIPMLVANNQVVQLDQGGTITLNTTTTPIKVNVTYAPSFRENLISVGQLARENNAQVVMDGNKAVVTFDKGKGGQIVANKHGNMYIMEQKNQNTNKQYNTQNTNKNSSTEITDSSHAFHTEHDQIALLHQRLGHVGTAALIKIQHAVTGLENVDAKDLSRITCHGCAVGRSHRYKFTSHNNEQTPTDKMDMVVADLCGPIFNKYISLIIDVRTGKVFINIINKKSETTPHVIQWDRHAKTQTGKILKRFHSDGGGEYRSNMLKSYFEKQGTIMTTTTRDTPQHNGIAERMNRTILEIARAMLFHAQMHVSYWQDAVLTAVYLINYWVPTTMTVENMTRHEAWTGHKPSISHLRVFGCDVYRHILRDQRTNKMSVTSRAGVFIGYDEEKNGYYKIWDPQERKLYRTRDVQFVEHQFTRGKNAKHAMWNSHNTTTTNTSSTNNDSSDITTELYETIVYKKPVETDQQIEMEHKYDEQKEGQEQEQKETAEQEQEQEQEQTQELEIDTSSIENESEASESEARYPSRHRQAPESFYPLLRTDLMSDREMTNMTTQQQQQNNNTAVPSHYQQAMSSDARDMWIQAQNEEMKSHEQNNTWTVMPLPAGKHAIDCMWVYAVKLDENGNIARHKARLVAKGFMQQYGIDYFDTYSAVMRHKSLRVMLMIAAILNLELVQMDVITAFLHADMEEEVYMKQPRGYQQYINMVLKLNKSLYGTRQASHNWNGVLNDFILSVGFTRCTTDTCIYVKQSRTGQLMIIGVFVDDMPIAYHKQDEQEWTEIKHAFMTRFRMKDMGECKLILGMRITRDRSNNTLTIDNQVHINNMLRTHGMQDCKHAPTPAAATQLTATTKEESGIVDIRLYQSIVGSLNYLVQTCRPDIAHAVNAVCRHGANPSPSHLVAAKRIMRYLAGTAHMGLTYNDKYTNKDMNKDKNKNDANWIQITAFTDADWGGDHHDRKSTTGYVIKLNGCTVSWATKKQQTVAISTTEAEYMAIAAGAQEILWMQQFVNELTQTCAQTQPQTQTPTREINMSSTATLYCDNQSALAISRNDVHHHRTKHIDIKHHFIRDHVKAKRIDVVWIPTQDQVADVLTKPLDKIKFARFRYALLNITFKQQA
jgi:hypothetical protein